MKHLITAALVAAALVAGPAAAASTLDGSTVTFREFNHVQQGWSRYRVQHTFGNEGTRVAMWAGPHGHRHLLKSYPADGGGRVTVEYVGPPRSKFFAGPYHLRRETWPSQ